MKSTKITPPEGWEVDEEKSSFTEIFYKPIKSKYPLSVMELPYGERFYINEHSQIYSTNKLSLTRDFGDLNLCSTKERAEAILALIQLVELRDAWNRVDGFVANWEIDKQCKYSICIKLNNIETVEYSFSNTVLHFGKASTRDLFLETHRKLIETAKEFI